MVERSPNEAPSRMRGYINSPTSMRLVGGMGVLTDAIYQRLDGNLVLTGHTVRQLQKTELTVEVDVDINIAPDDQGASKKTTWQASHVLLALPPRLVEHNIKFIPTLPENLAKQWRATATWMAPHAKYIAVYDTPFWRQQGLSGSVSSTRGPLTEIHDASTFDGQATLFGFFGVPPDVRQSVCEDELKSHCRTQLVRLFGIQAEMPMAESFKDWSRDSFTATSINTQSGGQHARAPASKAMTGVWQ